MSRVNVCPLTLTLQLRTHVFYLCHSTPLLLPSRLTSTPLLAPPWMTPLLPSFFLALDQISLDFFETMSLSLFRQDTWTAMARTLPLQSGYLCRICLSCVLLGHERYTPHLDLAVPFLRSWHSRPAPFWGDDIQTLRGPPVEGSATPTLFPQSLAPLSNSSAWPSGLLSPIRTTQNAKHSRRLRTVASKLSPLSALRRLLA